MACATKIRGACVAGLCLGRFGILGFFSWRGRDLVEIPQCHQQLAGFYEQPCGHEVWSDRGCGGRGIRTIQPGFLTASSGFTGSDRNGRRYASSGRLAVEYNRRQSANSCRRDYLMQPLEQMNEFSEHYIAVGDTVSHLEPERVRLAEIWIETANDVPAAVQKWEKFGFTKISIDSSGHQKTAVERNQFTMRAAAMGASLVIYQAYSASPEPVYLAPVSHAARRKAEIELRPGGAVISMPEKCTIPPTLIGPIAYKAARLSEQVTNDLSSAVSSWRERGFLLLGTSDVVGRNDDMGSFDRMRLFATSVGASLICFQITPAKARAVRRHTDGRIDMEAIHSDLPVNAYPRGTSVIRVAFLAPTSLQSRKLLELDQKIGKIDFRLERE